MFSRCGVGDVGGEFEVEFAAGFVEVIGPAELVIARLDDAVTDAGGWCGDVKIFGGEVGQERGLKGDGDRGFRCEPFGIGVRRLGDATCGEAAAAAGANDEEDRKPKTHPAK